MSSATSGCLTEFFQVLAFFHFSFSTHRRVPVTRYRVGRGDYTKAVEKQRDETTSGDTRLMVRVDRFFTDFPRCLAVKNDVREISWIIFTLDRLTRRVNDQVHMSGVHEHVQVGLVE